MGNKSISYTLSFYISLAIVAIYLLFIILSYHENRRLLTENVESRAFAMGSKIVSAVRFNILSTEEVTENIAGMLPFYAEENKIEELILPLFKRYSFLHSIHVNFEKNGFPIPFNHLRFSRINDSVSVKKETNRFLFQCYAEKKSFEALLKNKTRGWSEPFKCHDDTVALTSFYFPFELTNHKNGLKSTGWISSELSLHFLNKELNHIQLGEKGFVQIVSEKGSYISHPDESKIFTSNLFNISRKEFRTDANTLHKILLNQETGSYVAYPELFNYTKCNVYHTPVKETGWMLFFVFHHAELYRSLNISLLRMILLSILGITMVILMIRYITRRLILPIKNVASEFENLSRKNEGYIESVRNEADALNRSLDRLKSRYQKIIDFQEKHGIDHEKINHDLIQASEIQKSIIKTNYPAFPDRKDIDIHTVFQPAQIISGDLYDYFFIDRANLLFAIGDVSGKGIPAALFMSVAHTLLRADLSGMEPNQIASRLNNELCSTDRHHFFLTLFIGILNTENGILKYCNAGHTISLLLRGTGVPEELPDSHGLPLGIYSERNYEAGSVRIDENDILILYTDGITETTGHDGKRYGYDKLKTVLSGKQVSSAIAINNLILNDLNLFRGTARQVDDICLLTLKFLRKV